MTGDRFNYCYDDCSYYSYFDCTTNSKTCYWSSLFSDRSGSCKSCGGASGCATCTGFLTCTTCAPNYSPSKSDTGNLYCHDTRLVADAAKAISTVLILAIVIPLSICILCIIGCCCYRRR